MNRSEGTKKSWTPSEKQLRSATDTYYISISLNIIQKKHYFGDFIGLNILILEAGWVSNTMNHGENEWVS